MSKSSTPKWVEEFNAKFVQPGYFGELSTSSAPVIKEYISTLLQQQKEEMISEIKKDLTEHGFMDSELEEYLDSLLGDK